MNRESAEYIAGLQKFLTLVRSRNLNSKIAVMMPFYGCHRDELIEVVAKYNQETKDDILVIDTKSWIAKTPIHPGRGWRRIDENS